MEASGESAIVGSRSVERALRLLHSVASAPNGLTLTKASESVELPTSTVARLLKTLESTGFVTRDEHGIYRPGVRLLQLGATATGNYHLGAVCEDHLLEIAEITGETAYLAVPDGVDVAIYLRQVESPRAIRHASWTGRAISTAGTAIGAAFASRVNRQGFAVSRGTPIEPEAAAAAAPVFDVTGRVVAAISVIGPSYRMSDEELSTFGARVAEHARAISTVLGFVCEPDRNDAPPSSPPILIP